MVLTLKGHVHKHGYFLEPCAVLALYPTVIALAIASLCNQGELFLKLQ